MKTNVTYEIQSGIPIPTHIDGSGRRRDPNSRLGVIRRLNVGDSVFFAQATTNIIASSCRTVRRRDGDATKKFTTRKVTENNIPGVRVWRTA